MKKNKKRNAEIVSPLYMRDPDPERKTFSCSKERVLITVVESSFRIICTCFKKFFIFFNSSAPVRIVNPNL